MVVTTGVVGAGVISLHVTIVMMAPPSLLSLALLRSECSVSRCMHSAPLSVIFCRAGAKCGDSGGQWPVSLTGGCRVSSCTSCRVAWELRALSCHNLQQTEIRVWRLESDEPGPTESCQQRAESGVEWSVQRITLRIMISRAGPGPAHSTDWPHCYQY